MKRTGDRHAAEIPACKGARPCQATKRTDNAIRNALLAAVVAMACGLRADGLTPMCGDASGTPGGIATSVTWYSDEAMTSTAGGTILVAPDLPQDFAMPQKFAVVVCTVPAAQADLTDVFSAAYISKYAGRVEKDASTYASEGLVTYTATWVKTGFTAIFR